MRNRKSGFTLIELMVVIMIIGVLAGILLPAFSRVRLRSRAVKVQTQAAAIASGVKAYYLEYGEFPVPNSALSTPKLYAYETDNDTVIERLESNHADNPRNIIFLEVEGLVRDGENGPFGVQWADGFQPFRVRIDTRYPSANAELADGVEVSIIDYKGSRIYE